MSSPPINASVTSVNALLELVYFNVRSLREARQRFSAQLAPDFRIFDYLRDDELSISRIIAALLDPRGRHGQGDVFLQDFIQQVNHLLQLQNKPAQQEWQVKADEDWKAKLEHSTDTGRRIDICLESKAGIIGIENKPWAPDLKNQLHDYADYLKKQPEAISGKWLLIYLSNHDPAEDSIPADEWESGDCLRMTYQDVENWLQLCATKTKALTVRVFIEEFAQFVRIHINKELDMTEENEIVRAIQQTPENISAAFSIMKALVPLKQNLLKKLFDDLDLKLKEKGFKLLKDNCWSNNNCSRYAGFNMALPGQDQETSDQYFRMEFNQRNQKELLWGIRRKDDKVPPEGPHWQPIHEVMNSTFGEEYSKRTDWWPWYRMNPDDQFPDEYRNWESSATPWIEITNGKLVDRIVQLADQVYDAFKDKLYLLQS